MTPSNAQIRLAIARAKGWEVVSFSDVNDYYFIDGEGEGVIAYSPLPNWPEDISAAWELVEEIRAANFLTKILMWDHTDRCAIEWTPRSGHNISIHDSFVEDSPCSRAICLAWLAWKGVSIDADPETKER